MEVGDDEEGVVEIGVEGGLGEDGAGESAGNEEGEEAEGEEHGGREPDAAAEEHDEPGEDFGGAGDGDGDGGESEGGSGVGVHAGDEHVVAPDAEAQERR